MPKPRIRELVRCRHFAWRLGKRDGVWQADGRSNKQNAGRHSIGTHDRKEALELLHRLDAVVAADLGLAPRLPEAVTRRLSLEEGRQLYEAHSKRPVALRGTQASTQKRYRTVFDKFIEFADGIHIRSWNEVTQDTLTDYATHPTDNDYAPKTIRNELVTLAQTIKYLIKKKQLVGVEPFQMEYQDCESERAYCYRTEEIAAMVQHCRAQEALCWLAGVIIALACTSPNWPHSGGAT